jgi:hypothetical protein
MMAVYRHKTDPDAGLIEVKEPEAEGRIKFHPQGGGMHFSMPHASFVENWELAPAPVFRRGTVTADFLPTGVGDPLRVLPCYGNGELWNGWGTPHFTRATVDKMIAAGLIDDMRWDGENVRVPGDEEEDDTYTPTVMPDGVTVWAIGAWGWTWDAVEFPPTLEDTVERMKREIRADIAAARVPADVKRFGDLDDHVDANCYGGFCEDDFMDRLVVHFGGLDHGDGMPEALRSHIDAAQDAINQWLANGGHQEALK